MFLIPFMNCSAGYSPFATRVNAFSQSAVSLGLLTTSGRTVISFIPSSVGIICFLSLFTKPSLTSFSMISARVAGVPSPLRSTSSPISSTPARSIAESRLSSVKCFGGCVKPSTTLHSEGEYINPSVSGGRDFSSSSSFSILTLYSLRSAASYFFHPGSTTVVPDAVKVLPPHSSSALILMY